MALTNPALELTAHRGIRMLTAVFLLLAIYALADFYANPWAYAGIRPWLALAGIGVLAGMTAWRVGRGAARAERLPATFLLAGAAAAAGYSGLLRLNQATASVPPQRVTYAYVGHGRFETAEAGYPPLSPSRFPQAWLEDRVNAIHPFEMIRGGLGFYQYNQARLQDEMRAQLRLEDLQR
ncbi:MAG: hypothetical protein E6R07_06315 [Nevskiaceae bacterium]|nr:MAG: hypothetical protein E6R07_06315 [Nevskiaceae bacterium]